MSNLSKFPEGSIEEFEEWFKDLGNTPSDIGNNLTEKLCEARAMRKSGSMNAVQYIHSIKMCILLRLDRIKSDEDRAFLTLKYSEYLI